VRLTEHFTYEELTVSQEAARKGLDNTPPPDLMPNLRYLARQLEEIRRLIGKPILVTSGYRSPAVNEAVGGSKTSTHMKGLAADIIAPGFGIPYDLCKAIAAMEDLNYDQVIHEFQAWTHVGFSFGGDTPRRQVLTINNGGAGYVKGILP